MDESDYDYLVDRIREVEDRMKQILDVIQGLAKDRTKQILDVIQGLALGRKVEVTGYYNRPNGERRRVDKAFGVLKEVDKKTGKQVVVLPDGECGTFDSSEVKFVW